MDNNHYNLKRLLFLLVSSIIIFVNFVLVSSSSQKKKYKNAESAYNEENYDEALELFTTLGFYEDSFDRAREASNYLEFNKAMDYLNQGIEKEAKENNAEIEEITDEEMSSEELYSTARSIFYSLGTFNESNKYWEVATFRYARQLFNKGEYEQAAELFKSIINYVDKESGDDANSYYSKSMYQDIDTILENVYNDAYNKYIDKNYIEAYINFKDLVDKYGYGESREQLQKCRTMLVRQNYGHTISAGIRYSIAINNENEIIVWGDISTQNKDFLESLSGVVSISGFGNVVAGLKEDGTVAVSADSNVDKDIESADSWVNIVSIKTGDQYIVGLDEDGNIYGAGANRDNQWDFTNWGKIISFDTAWRRTVGVDENNVIHITGYGSERHLREIEKANRAAENTTDEEIAKKAWNNVVAVATGGGYEEERGHTVGLKNDGTVVAVGDNENNQCAVGNWENVIKIAAGDHHTVGLTSDGHVLYAGKPNDKLVDPDGYVKDWDNIVAIDAGRDYTLALTGDGEILSFGDNKQGQRPSDSDDSDKSNILIYEWKEIEELLNASSIE